ncbi:MAG: hypothetical protein NTW36_08850 [Planctomycetia bacterium]|nr:hypothetical protein [Planctomycetia bacterium]
MKLLSLWMIVAAMLWTAPNLYSEDASLKPPESQQAPMPPAGHQLSSVKGVSIVRVDSRDQATTPYISFKRTDFYGRGRITATRLPLSSILLDAAPVDADHLFLNAPLPDGLYNVEISTPRGGNEKMFELLQMSLARSFRVQARVANYDEPVVALRKTADWDKRPLPRVKGVLFDTPIVQFHLFEEVATNAQGHVQIKFKGDMECLAKSGFDEYFGKPVVNQTGIEGLYSFDIALQQASKTADLVAFLKDHGLVFVADNQKKIGVYVEPLR